MHRNISIHQAEGRRITKVYDADKGYKAHKSSVKAPGKRLLFNFDLRFGDRTILVLDNYGYESIAGSDLERLVFDGGVGLYADETKKQHKGYTLGIDRDTGVIYAVAFGIEKRQVVAIIWEFPTDQETPLRFPKRLLKQVDTLKSRKRPFDITFPTNLLVAFIDRGRGSMELARNFVLQFDFRPRGILEVWGSSHRFTTEWK